MNVELKHKQHYVFQRYLSAWTKENQLCCKRKGKKFSTGTINVAQQRDFYRIMDLNDDEKKFLSIMWRKKSDETKEIMANYIRLYEEPLRVKRNLGIFKNALVLRRFKDRELPNEVSDQFAAMEADAEKYINDLVEETYSDEEGRFTQTLVKLIAGDTDFYYHPYHEDDSAYDNTRREFLAHLCSQCYRTKASRERMVYGLNRCLTLDFPEGLDIVKENIRPEHAAYCFLWYISGQMADALYDMNAHLTLLHNDTNVHFITTDQPVINLEADYSDMTDEVTKIVLYYPITPTLAITVNDDNVHKSIKLSENEVHYYNQRMASASHEMIFADDAELLDHYAGAGGTVNADA
ncbi:MAG: DUF4238 domain-containing protein [Clostridia bacterium]|nr:DUF4238 domain-containing protein [Clostridia bacterium]